MTNLVNKDTQKIRKLIAMIQNVKKILLQDNEKYEVLSFFTRIAIERRIIIQHDLYNYMIFKSLNNIIQKPRSVYFIISYDKKNSSIYIVFDLYSKPYASNDFLLDMFMKQEFTKHLLFYYLYRKPFSHYSNKTMIEKYYPESRKIITSFLNNKISRHYYTQHKLLNYFTNISMIVFLFKEFTRENRSVKEIRLRDDKNNPKLIDNLVKYYGSHLQQAIERLDFTSEDVSDYYKKLVRKL